MLQDVYDELRMRRLEPRWVGDEVHVEVHGRAFAVADHPQGVSVRKQHTVSQAEAVADICARPEQAIAALGL